MGIAFRLLLVYDLFKQKTCRKMFDNSEDIKYDGIRTYVRNVKMKGEMKIMTERAKELIKLIRENDNPEQALMTAAVIILGFLKQHESSEEQDPVCLQVLG